MVFPLNPVRIINTCAWTKAITNSNIEKAKINARGTKPKKKNKKPDVIILYVKKLRMFRSKWAEEWYKD